MPWFLIVVAGLFETGFAVLLKQSASFTKLWPTVGFAVCTLASFGLLTMALRRLKVGPAYAVWTGVGAAGTAVVGMAALGESVSAAKIASIAPGAVRRDRAQPLRRQRLTRTVGRQRLTRRHTA